MNTSFHNHIGWPDESAKQLFERSRNYFKPDGIFVADDLADFLAVLALLMNAGNEAYLLQSLAKSFHQSFNRAADTSRFTALAQLRAGTESLAGAGQSTKPPKTKTLSSIATIFVASPAPPLAKLAYFIRMSLFESIYRYLEYHAQLPVLAKSVRTLADIWLPDGELATALGSLRTVNNPLSDIVLQLHGLHDSYEEKPEVREIAILLQHLISGELLGEQQQLPASAAVESPKLADTQTIEARNEKSIRASKQQRSPVMRTDRRSVGYGLAYQILEPFERQAYARLVREFCIGHEAGENNAADAEEVVTIAVMVMSLSLGLETTQALQQLTATDDSFSLERGSWLLKSARCLNVEIRHGGAAYHPVYGVISLRLPRFSTNLLSSARKIQLATPFTASDISRTYMQRFHHAMKPGPVRCLLRHARATRHNILLQCTGDDEFLADILHLSREKSTSIRRKYIGFSHTTIEDAHEAALKGAWAHTVWHEMVPILRSPIVDSTAVVGIGHRLRASVAKLMLASLYDHVDATRSATFAEHFNAWTILIVTLVLAATGHRPVNDVLSNAGDVFLRMGFIQIDDKASSPAHRYRWVPIAPLLQAFLRVHIRILKEVAGRIAGVENRQLLDGCVSAIDNTAATPDLPLFFLISTTKNTVVRLTAKRYRAEFQCITNSDTVPFRAALWNGLLERNVPVRIVSTLAGHQQHDHPLGQSSIYSIADLQKFIAPINEHLESMGWRNPPALTIPKKIQWNLSFASKHGASLRAAKRKRNDLNAGEQVNNFVKSESAWCQHIDLEMIAAAKKILFASDQSKEHQAAVRRQLRQTCLQALQGGALVDDEVFAELSVPTHESSPYSSTLMERYQQALTLRDAFVEHYSRREFDETLEERCAWILLSVALYSGTCSATQLETFFAARIAHSWEYKKQLHIQWMPEDRSGKHWENYLPKAQLKCDPLTQLLIQGAMKLCKQGKSFRTRLAQMDGEIVNKALQRILEKTVPNTSPDNIVRTLASLSRTYWTVVAPGWLRARFRGELVSQPMSAQRYIAALQGRVLTPPEAGCSEEAV